MSAHSPTSNGSAGQETAILPVTCAGSPEHTTNGIAVEAKPLVKKFPDSCRRSSQQTEQLRYGRCGWYPSWLQWLNNIVGVVVFISLANCLQTMTSGSVGVVISTIEKRFGLTSTKSSWIAVGYDIGMLPLLALLSMFGTRVHRPLLISGGLLLISLGCVLFFLPQFTSPSYQPRLGDAAVNTKCDVSAVNSTSSSCDDVERDGQSLSHYLVMFVFARMLIGVGAAPIVSVAINYIDDCSTKEKFARYFGIYMSMSVVGPAIGFIFGANALQLFTDFYAKSSVGIDSDDPSWIGAWWLPYTLIAGLSLLNAIPMSGYPSDLPGAAEIRANKVTEAHNARSVSDSTTDSHSQQTNSGSVGKYDAIGAIMKSVFTNPTYVCLTVFSACDNFIVAGFSAYGPKVFEFGLGLEPSTAGMLFGAVLLPAGAIGTVVGGLIIEKLRLSCKQILRIQTVLAVAVTLGCLLFLLISNTVDFAGVSVPYNHSVSDVYVGRQSLKDSCNANCMCDDAVYKPICSHDFVQYYSPCHAGCQHYTDDNYFNCSCISSRIDGSNASMATSGVCSRGIESKTIIFLIGFFITVFAVFFCVTTTTAATLRCISSSQTTFAISAQVLLMKLLGMIPGPLLMGIAFDLSCIKQRPSVCGSADGDETSCMFYDSRRLSLNLLSFILSFKCISVIVMIIAVALYKPPKVSEKDLVVTVTMTAAENGIGIHEREKLEICSNTDSASEEKNVL